MSGIEMLKSGGELHSQSETAHNISAQSGTAERSSATDERRPVDGNPLDRKSVGAQNVPAFHLASHKARLRSGEEP